MFGKNAAKQFGNKRSAFGSEALITQSEKKEGGLQRLKDRALHASVRDDPNRRCVFIEPNLAFLGARNSLLFQSGCKQCLSAFHLNH